MENHCCGKLRLEAISHLPYLHYLQKNLTAFFPIRLLIYKFYMPKQLKILYLYAAISTMVRPINTALVWWGQGLSCK